MQTPFGIRLAYPGGSLRYAGATLHASQRALHSSQAMTFIAWFIFIGAALLEVSGDAAVRQGLRSRQASWILAGCSALALYGLLVNSVKWDFSKLLGVYVAFFAIVSVLFGRFVFNERLSAPTLAGVAFIAIGGLLIQFGHK